MPKKRTIHDKSDSFSKEVGKEVSVRDSEPIKLGASETVDPNLLA